MTHEEILTLLGDYITSGLISVDTDLIGGGFLYFRE